MFEIKIIDIFYHLGKFIVCQPVHALFPTRSTYPDFCCLKSLAYVIGTIQPTFLLISAPSLGVYYFLSLTLSVCLSVTDKLQIGPFLFLDGIDPFFGRQFSMWHSTKRCSSIFDLGPLTPKIYSPKFALAQNRL